MRRIGRFIRNFFATIGVLVFLLVCGGAALWIFSHTREPKLADNTILTIDLSRALTDAAPDTGVQQLLFASSMSLIQTLNTIERAGDDPRIKGIVARIGDNSAGIAQIQELRDAIAGFRAKGKRAVAYTDTFGELSSGTRSYYLAAAFDEIWLQPMGLVGLVGLRAELPYFRGTLDKLGIVPDFEHREEFKDAENTMTETGMTGPEREELQALVDSIYGQIVDGVAKDRKIDPAQLKTLIDHAPVLTNDALKAHLIDHIGMREDAVASFGASPHLTSLKRYHDDVGEAHKSGPTIALIYASGMISRGTGGEANPLTGSGGANTDELVRAFRMAQEDKAVKAILFRVDSPGGSATASETIWAAVQRAHKAGKPVIVSMGDVAGSGGYYIAAPADKIVAEPATFTGSIGVVAGKIAVGGLLKKFGGNYDSIQAGANAGMFGMMDGFSPVERERLNAVLDDIYGGFKQRVADGRKLTPEAVEAVAKGRVWSGADAQSRGLVDTLGGFKTALDVTKQVAGIAAGDDVTLKLYPPAKSGIRAIASRVLGDDDEAQASLPTQLLTLWRVALQRIALMIAPPGSLTMKSFDAQ